MMRVCLGYPGYRCGRLIRGTNRCGDCQRAMYRIRAATRDPAIKALYGRNAWRTLAESVVAAAAGCTYCGRTDVKLTADHVIAIRLDPSRALDPTNVVAACRSCQEKRKHDPTWWGAVSRRG